MDVNLAKVSCTERVNVVQSMSVDAWNSSQIIAVFNASVAVDIRRRRRR